MSSSCRAEAEAELFGELSGCGLRSVVSDSLRLEVGYIRDAPVHKRVTEQTYNNSKLACFA